MGYDCGRAVIPSRCGLFVTMTPEDDPHQGEPAAFRTRPLPAPLASPPRGVAFLSDDRWSVRESGNDRRRLPRGRPSPGRRGTNESSPPLGPRLGDFPSGRWAGRTASRGRTASASARPPSEQSRNSSLSRNSDIRNRLGAARTVHLLAGIITSGQSVSWSPV